MFIMWLLSIKTLKKLAKSAGLRAIGGGYNLNLICIKMLQKIILEVSIVI